MKSKLAIISFILGLISLISLPLWNAQVGTIISLLMILSGPIGLILGIVSIFIIKRNNLEGMWFAILGILFSLISIVVMLIIGLGIGGALSFV